MSQLLNDIEELLADQDDGGRFLELIGAGVETLSEPEQAEAGWESRRGRFLEALEVDERELSADPLLFAVEEFVRYVDNDAGEENRWPALPDEQDARDAWADRCYWSWIQGDDTYESWLRRVGLAWVDEDQRTRLGASWWRKIIELLSESWPQWWNPATSEDELGNWLSGQISSCTVAGEAAEPVTGLGWIDPGEAEQLFGGNWRSLIILKLDQVWPQWRGETDTAVLTKWLSDWSGAFQAVRDLGWLTDEQRTQLAALGPGWRDRLRQILDGEEVWPQWRVETDTGLLARWLDGWLPALAVSISQRMPDENPEQQAGSPEAVQDTATKVVSEVAIPALARLAKLPGLADASPEQLAAILTQALTNSAAETASIS